MNWLRSIFGSPTDPKSIERSIERQRRKAENSGLVAAFTVIAQVVFYFPSWIADSREAVPANITEARELERRRVELIVNPGGRSFVLVRTDGPSYVTREDHEATVQLFVQGELCFEVQVPYSLGEYGEAWYQARVSAFIEGGWQKDIYAMAHLYREWSKSATRKSRADSLERQKKRFGL